MLLISIDLMIIYIQSIHLGFTRTFVRIYSNVMNFSPLHNGQISLPIGSKVCSKYPHPKVKIPKAWS